MTPITLTKEPELIIPSHSPVKKFTLLALATLMALGLTLTAFLNAPWYVPLIFFTLILASLFPLGQRVDIQRDLYLSNALLQ